MTKHSRAAILAALLMTCAPALAGEVNGSSANPKDDFSRGVSFCKFSGLNDDPERPSTAPMALAGVFRTGVT
jgi:hypothetical protein